MSLQFELIADLGPELGDLVPIVTSVGPAGESLWLATSRADQEAMETSIRQPGPAPSPDPSEGGGYAAWLFVHDGIGARSFHIPQVSPRYPKLQRTGGGEFLIVDSRCTAIEDGSPDKNASVFGPDGTLRRAFTLGDGIEDVQVSADDSVWVSYFDEGIFGNWGWKVAGELGLEPIAPAGLIRTDADGSVTWRYAPPEGIGSISDCYALNVDGDAAWAYYYTNFPLVRIGLDGLIVAWRSGVSGAKAFAIAGDQVLFFGGYEARRTALTLARIGGDALEDHEDIDLDLPGADSLSHAAVVGRGSAIHAFVGRRWYRLDLAKA